MRTLAVICARKGNWDKNAEPVGGVPMVVRAIEAVRSAVDLVAVSTDSLKVMSLARKARVAVFERPENLCGEKARIEDAARHVVREIRADYDTVLVVQANMPIWDKMTAPACIFGLADVQSWTACASAVEVHQRPEWMKVADLQWKVRPFMPNVRHYRRQDLPRLYYLDGQVVAIRTECLLHKWADDRVHGWMGPRVGIVAHDQFYAIEVHDSSDLRMAEIAFETMKGASHA